MLECEGYKMFRGTATVTPKNPKFPTETISGTWLYKPEYDCWYVNGRSFMADIVSDFVEFQPTLGEWISVEERLPKRKSDKEIRGWFLVCLESGCVKSLRYEFGSGKYDDLLDIGWEKTGSPVKYWKPLPLPPWVE